MGNPICLITGATDGLGKATALALAARGFRVVLSARNTEKAEAVRRQITAASPAAEVTCLPVDLASLAQTRSLADHFKRGFPRLDVLINNAGVFLPRRTVTGDGFETTHQVNYLSHFLLTHLLLGELKKSAEPRIINLSSSVYALARFDADNLQSEKRYSSFGTYAASKLCMLMFTEELSRRLEGTGITANAVDPGVVRTPMMRNAPGALRIVSYLALPFSISAEAGARTSVHLATSPEVRGVSGAYFASSKQRATRNRFDTAANRRLLWELSAKSVGA